MGATAKTIAGRFGWIISLSQLGDPGQVLRSFRLRFELIQFSSKTRSFPSVGVTAIPTVKETIPPAQAVKWIFVFPIRQVPHLIPCPPCSDKLHAVLNARPQDANRVGGIRLAPGFDAALQAVILLLVVALRAFKRSARLKQASDAVIFRIFPAPRLRFPAVVEVVFLFG